jgi:NADPH:quinone reductase-like Zn-dependent oxidoreductase
VFGLALLLARVSCLASSWHNGSPHWVSRILRAIFQKFNTGAIGGLLKLPSGISYSIWRTLTVTIRQGPQMTTPTRMRAMQARAFDIEALTIAQTDVPRPRRGEILLRVRAATLNYRDLVILRGAYLPNLPLPYVPASDAAGEVVELGEDVTRFRVGDRVMPTYTQGWYDGMPTQEQRQTRTLGAPLTGVLQEYVVVPAEDAVAVPDHLTDVEAATLPIAAVTAWSALLEGGIKPGASVLVQGTGGVALFALQFAKLHGASVVIISSSDDKLARARSLGADIGINYRTTPKWETLVRDATRGRGADIIVETAGATLGQSVAALAFGGVICVVGFVAGMEAALSLRGLIGPMARIQGIAVGSRARFEAMNRAIEQHRLRPSVDTTFPLDQSAEAFRRMERGAHFGKIAITI